MALPCFLIKRRLLRHLSPSNYVPIPLFPPSPVDDPITERFSKGKNNNLNNLQQNVGGVLIKSRTLLAVLCSCQSTCKSNATNWKSNEEKRQSRVQVQFSVWKTLRKMENQFLSRQHNLQLQIAASWCSTVSSANGTLWFVRRLLCMPFAASIMWELSFCDSALSATIFVE